MINFSDHFKEWTFGFIDSLLFLYFLFHVSLLYFFSSASFFSFSSSSKKKLGFWFEIFLFLMMAFMAIHFPLRADFPTLHFCYAFIFTYLELFLNFPSDFCFDSLTGYLRKYLKIFQIPFSYWFLISFHCGERRCLVWVQFSKFIETWYVWSVV